MNITQPIGQVRLTNVAVVRLKRNGKRFEVAAYKNKVVNWRNNVETDINEVLQTQSVFTNVSRGVLASRSELMEAFGTDDHVKCSLIILAKGELEVSEKERQLHYETLFRDIATNIAEKCVNPETSRPYPVSIIQKALQDVHFSVIPTKSSKAQASKALQMLKGYMPIERARMRVKIVLPRDTQRKGLHLPSEFAAWLREQGAVVDASSISEHDSKLISVDAVIDPGHYKLIEAELARVFPGTYSTLDVISLTVSGFPEDSAAPESAAAEVDGSPAAAGGRDVGNGKVESFQPMSGSTDASARATGIMVRKVAQPTARLACNACKVEFTTTDELRAHHKTDLHRFNLKRKVRGLESLDQAAFDAMPAKERQIFMDTDA